MANPSRGEILRSSSRTYLKRKQAPTRRTPRKTIWQVICFFSTLLIPNFVLSCFGMKTKSMQDAWREKVTLCLFILYACFLLAFLTYGMNTIVCRADNKFVYGKLHRTRFDEEILIARGGLYTISEGHKHADTLAAIDRKNATLLFPIKSDACKRAFGKQIRGHGYDGLKLKDDNKLTRVGPIYYSWSDISNNSFITVDDKVYDPSPCSEEYFSDFISKYQGKDGTRAMKEMGKDEVECFKQSFLAGDIETKSYGCLVADFMLYLSTVAIFGLIIVRFILAILYSWIMGSRTKRLMRSITTESTSPCILLVTCYSEGKEGLIGTIDSLCKQEYSPDYKLIVVIADGMIKGSENDQTTPAILLDLIEKDSQDEEAMNYIALAAGEKRNNRAKVYTGFYKADGKITRIMIIIKIGNEREISKAGNRGKRDSQVILMGFFQRLIYRDRLTPLDFEIYRKMKHCMPKIEPASFELVLMVDADTIVRSDALQHMVAVFESDHKIMGMTGETKIINKAESFVTMIQVFEYYISHHLSKAFESVFGGVTCLPGCFCMYRIQTFKKVARGIESNPILAHPFILNAYSVHETTTLHQKNLLLLGEDRYLTTLLLKTFYKRKMIFLPAAKCGTQVPNAFKILLSQRRRWINSTVHNLFELVQVSRLCGTFCCSMQFVVCMELMGTLVLPAAIIFTGVLIFAAFYIEPAWIPLIMLFGILGLPAFLILLTTREISYIFWIVVYIFSLPIWNFVFPVYAFWHFDDFSWGETRKVEGEEKNHGESEGVFDPKKIPLKHFHDEYPEFTPKDDSDDFLY
ncbi:hypothetical protein COBT_000487 [Conglomerata obtusa]